MTVSPSTRTSSDKFYDAGEQPTPMWYNSTPFVEDTAGRYYSSEDNKDGDDQGWMPLVSNATYIVQMSENTENQVGLDLQQWIDPNWDVGSFDWLLPLISREVSDVAGRSYFVNNLAVTIDTRMVRSTFGVTFTETIPTQTLFGDQNNPSALWIDTEATINIAANYVYEYYFDSLTGMIVEMREDSTYSIDLNYFNSSTINPQPGPTPLSVDFTLSMSGAKSSLQTLNEASSFYGNTRAVSSGANRIVQDDLLVYDSESSNEFSFDSDMVVGDSSTTGWESYDSQWGYSDGYGTVSYSWWKI